MLLSLSTGRVSVCFWNCSTDSYFLYGNLNVMKCFLLLQYFNSH